MMQDDDLDTKWDHDDALEQFCGEVRDKHRPQISTLAIGCYYYNGSMRQNGREVVAKCHKVTRRERELFECEEDFQIVVARPTWEMLSGGQRVAWMHHELCHCGVDEDGQPYMVEHDLQEFAEVVRVHGLIDSAHAEMGRAFQPHLPHFDEPEAKPKKKAAPTVAGTA
jgi:hypothetical protein